MVVVVVMVVAMVAVWMMSMKICIFRVRIVFVCICCCMRLMMVMIRMLLLSEMLNMMRPVEILALLPLSKAIACVHFFFHGNPQAIFGQCACKGAVTRLTFTISLRLDASLFYATSGCPIFGSHVVLILRVGIGFPG